MPALKARRFLATNGPRAFVAAAAVLFAASAGAQVTYGLDSLRGTYSYVNVAENIATFGLITFDGKGKLTATVKINRATPTGGRTIATVSESGTYTVEPDGQGVATIQIPGAPEPAIYDFLITQTATAGAPPAKGRGKLRTALATEVFSVNRSGGLSGQVVAPTWTRRADQ
jgi:hypothetical protein